MTILRALLTILSLAMALPAGACEMTRGWFDDASDADMTACMRLDFVSRRADDGATVLHLAIAAGAAPDVLEAIRQAARGEWALLRDARDDVGWTALHVAAGAARDPRVVTWLLASGADADALAPPVASRGEYVGRVLPERGTTALHIAAVRRDGAGVVTALVAGGARMRPDAAGDLPIHLAAKTGAGVDTLAAFLAASGGDGDVFNRPDAGGRGALHLAAGGDAGLLRYMLDAGADADATDDAGRTPLHEASARASDADSVRLLFEFAADPCLPDRTGQTPLDALTGPSSPLRGDADLVALLREACPDAP